MSRFRKTFAAIGRWTWPALIALLIATPGDAPVIRASPPDSFAKAVIDTFQTWEYVQVADADTIVVTACNAESLISWVGGADDGLDQLIRRTPAGLQFDIELRGFRRGSQTWRYDPPLLMVPGNPVAGQRWSYQGVLTDPEGVSESLSLEFEVVGLETIDLPFGPRQAWRLSEISQATQASISSGHEGPVASRSAGRSVWGFRLQPGKRADADRWYSAGTRRILMQDAVLQLKSSTSGLCLVEVPQPPVPVTWGKLRAIYADTTASP